MINRPDNLLPNLLDFTLEEMEEFISSLGKKKFRARQIMKWLHQSGSVSFEPLARCQTKLTIHSAAGLSGNANSPMAFTGDQNTFDKKIIFQTQERFFCTILRCENFDDLRTADAGDFRELGAEVAGEGGHVVERKTAGLMQPFHCLPRAEFFFTQRGKKFFHFLQREIQ